MAALSRSWPSTPPFFGGPPTLGATAAPACSRSRWTSASTVFFVISGFLLYRPFAKARLRGEPARRSARLRVAARSCASCPAYWVALTWSRSVLGRTRCSRQRRCRRYYGFAQIYDAEHGARRHRAGLDAVRGGDVLRAPAALGAGACARCRRGDPQRAAGLELAGLALLVVASGAYKVWALRQVGPDRRSAPAPYLMPLPELPRPVRARDGAGRAQRLVRAAASACPARSSLCGAAPGLVWVVAAWPSRWRRTRIGSRRRALQQYAAPDVPRCATCCTGVVALCVLLPACSREPGRGLVAALLRNPRSCTRARLLRRLPLPLRRHRPGGRLARAALDGAIRAALPGLRAARTCRRGAAGQRSRYYAVERPALRLKRLVGGSRDSRAARRRRSRLRPAPLAPRRR